MHELGITDQLLGLVLKHAQEAKAAKVVGVSLVIGEFSSVVDESIQFYWDMMAEDTIAEGAVLAFERVPGKLRCETCGVEFLFSDYEGQCPACGGQRTQIIDGNQFRLDSIEVQGADEHEFAAD